MLQVGKYCGLTVALVDLWRSSFPRRTAKHLKCLGDQGRPRVSILVFMLSRRQRNVGGCDCARQDGIRRCLDSSYLRMPRHLGDYADPSSDCAGLSKDPFLRSSSTRTGRGAYVAYGSKAPLTERPVVAVVSTDRRNTLSWRKRMECSDGSGISSRVYNGREDGVMGSLAARRVAEGD